MKDWRDLFYFSKSERRALTLLSFLILGAWLLLWVTEPEEEEPMCKSKFTLRIITLT